MVAQCLASAVWCAADRSRLFPGDSWKVSGVSRRCKEVLAGDEIEFVVDAFRSLDANLKAIGAELAAARQTLRVRCQARGRD